MGDFLIFIVSCKVSGRPPFLILWRMRQRQRRQGNASVSDPASLLLADLALERIDDTTGGAM
jgi:hypothetical protein